MHLLVIVCLTTGATTRELYVSREEAISRERELSTGHIVTITDPRGYRIEMSEPCR
jgi:hypothetical protein